MLTFPLGRVIAKLSAIQYSPFWQDFGEKGKAFFQRNVSS
jgi:hypothetical protein